MIGLIQRVDKAQVEISGEIIASVQHGLVTFIGVERGDTEAEAGRLIERILGYRVFPDDDGKMNRCLGDINGGLLLVPQFTLAADTRKGTRPSFSPAAPPEEARRLFDSLAEEARRAYARVGTGRFGAAMKVSLVNDGPVTFWLQVSPSRPQTEAARKAASQRSPT
ncbi:MAG: D-aminoacyl-tRNA deacylase [Gammaproteobacteria bacterium]|nr:D-aminoacyl-tRNA deacylase [Gammaproteobacteria bacterium]